MSFSGFSRKILSQRPKLTCGDAQTGEEIIDDSPGDGLQLDGDPKGLDAAIDGDSDDEEDIEPVDMLMPVVTVDGSIGDVDLLGKGRVDRLCRHDACQCALEQKGKRGSVLVCRPRSMEVDVTVTLSEGKYGG